MRKPSLSIRKAAVIAAVTAAGALAAAFAVSSSHREAPNIMLDPSADNTDTYAWTAPDAKHAITVAANWIPGQVPANGPNFFRFDDRARYYIQFDNTGDGVADVKYRFKFKTRFNNPNSFLYAGPGTTGFNDPGLNVIQRYKVTRLKYKRGKLKSSKVVAKGLPVAPPNIGPKTFPEYDNFVDAATRTLPGGGKIFAGQRDESFFIDLGATFDAINIREGTGNEGEGKDDLSGMSTSAIVLQLPEKKVTKNAQAGRRRRRQERSSGRLVDHRQAQAPGHGCHRAGSQYKSRGRKNKRYVQVSRLGNPLVNELVIPLGKKDQFNRTTPDEDAARYGKFVLKPELAAILNALFGVGAPETDRTDIVQAVLQGIPDLNEHSGKNAGTPVDTLKLNLGVPPSDDPSRFGVIGGDNAGYPNGRRPIDDVVDIDLQVVAGILVGNPVALGDGVDMNDKPFLSKFPYLAAPDSGFDSRPSDRFEPPHDPVPPGGGS